MRKENKKVQKNQCEQRKNMQNFAENVTQEKTLSHMTDGNKNGIIDKKAVICLELCRYRTAALGRVHIKHQNGWGVISVILTMASLEFTQNSAIKKKHPVSSSLDTNSLLTKEVN